MFTKPAFAYIALFVSVMTGSLATTIRKRGETKIIIKTPRDTRLVDPTDKSHPVVNGGSHTFDFTKNPSGNQTFWWDIFRADSNYMDEFYHLTCVIGINRTLTGTFEFELHNVTAKPHVTMVSGPEEDENQVAISCPLADCRSENKETCDAKPSWIAEEEGEYRGGYQF